MEDERDPVRLHEDALKGVMPATVWGQGSERGERRSR